MLDVTGAHFKPILPAYILNKDCSSQYYFVGDSCKNCTDNSWARVGIESLVSRNKDSIWSNNYSTKGLCKGIRVRYICGGSAAGFIYPICVIISSLSKDEIQQKEFVVIPIEGFSINGYIDLKNK